MATTAEEEASADLFYHLLDGLVQKNFYGKDISERTLKCQLYPSVPDAEFAKLTAKCNPILKALQAADDAQLEALLTSLQQSSASSRATSRALTPAEVQAVRRLWRNRRTSLRQAFLDRSRWNAGAPSQMYWELRDTGTPLLCSLGPDVHLQLDVDDVGRLAEEVGAVRRALRRAQAGSRE